MGLVLAEVAEVVGAHVIVFFAIFLEVIQQNKKKTMGKNMELKEKNLNPETEVEHSKKKGTKWRRKKKIPNGQIPKENNNIISDEE